MRVRQRPHREDRADRGDERARDHPQYVRPVLAQQHGQRQLRDALGRGLLGEGRGLLQRAADDVADDGDRDAQPERDAPAPGEQLVLGERGDRDEDQGGEQLAALGAAEGEAGEEAAPVRRRVFQRHGVGAGLLAGGGDALQDAAEHEQDRGEAADLVAGGQAADEERRQAHQDQREDHDLLAAQPVAEVAEEQRADRAGRVGDTEGGQREQGRGGRVGLVEEDLREDQGGGAAVDEEVVVLQGAADPGGQWRPSSAGRGRSAGRRGRTRRAPSRDLHRRRSEAEEGKCC